MDTIRMTKLENLILRFTEDYGLVQNLIRGYENMIGVIIDSLKLIGIGNLMVRAKYVDEDKNVVYSEVMPIAPNVCLRDKTSEYSIVILGKYSKEELSSEIITLPLLVGSRWCSTFGKSGTELQELGECATSKGGYFIEKGTEKFVPAHSKMSQNEIHTFRSKEKFISQFAI